MIHVRLNGKEVIPERDASIKIVKENPIMTKSGTFSLDVSFPMSIAENAAFFGNINRIECSKSRTTFELNVQSDGKDILAGSAVITSVTNDAVNVQFLAGNSDVNFWINAEDDYIDEIDYNLNACGVDIVLEWAAGVYTTWHENEPFATDDFTSESKYYLTYSVDSRFCEPDGKHPYVSRAKKGEFAFCKVYDETLNIDDSKYWPVGNGQFGSCMDSSDDHINIMRYARSSVQPNLVFVLRKIVEKRGYTLHNSFLDTEWYSNIYIASARPTFKIADTLPHWTVKDFISEVQKLFNCTIVFDELHKTASIYKNESVADVVEITDIEDIFEAQVEEDNAAKANLGFTNNDRPMHEILDEEFIKKHKVVRCSDYSDMGVKWRNMKEAELKWTIFYVEADQGSYYVYDEYGRGMRRTNLFGPIDLGGKDTDNLKIVPARIELRRYRAGRREQRLKQLWDEYIYVWETYYEQNVIVMKNTWGGYNKTTGSLFDVIYKEEDDNVKDKEDLMQIFCYDDDAHWMEFGYQKNKYRKMLVYKVKEGTRIIIDGPTESEIEIEGENIPVSNPRISLAFSDRTGFNMILQKPTSGTTRNLGERYAKNVRTDEFTTTQVRFLSPAPPDVTSVFHIRGKRYLCKKIEYDIDEDGIDPLMTGFFVEILE